MVIWCSFGNKTSIQNLSGLKQSDFISCLWHVSNMNLQEALFQVVFTLGPWMIKKPLSEVMLITESLGLCRRV